MDIVLKIPESIVQAIRLPEKRIQSELLVELAIGLYSQDLIAFSKACELAGRDRVEFGRLLTDRGINRHFDKEDLNDDLNYARRQ